MALPWGMLVLMVFMACVPSLALSSSPHHEVHVVQLISTISAAPAFLPTAPLASAPSLPPDIEPSFPTPKGMAPSPVDSSFPTIPASPSPPNPDAVLAPGPSVALSPSGTLPESASVSLTSAAALRTTLFLGLPVFCLFQ